MSESEEKVSEENIIKPLSDEEYKELVKKVSKMFLDRESKRCDIVFNPLDRWKNNRPNSNKIDAFEETMWWGSGDEEDSGNNYH